MSNDDSDEDSTTIGFNIIPCVVSYTFKGSKGWYYVSEFWTGPTRQPKEKFKKWISRYTYSARKSFGIPPSYTLIIDSLQTSFDMIIPLYKVGDYVICVDATDDLVLNETYKIIGVIYGRVYVMHESIKTSPLLSHLKIRFKPA